MTPFAVTLLRGSAWDWSRGLREQDEWEAHAALVDGLTAEGFVVLGGPLGDGRRVLLIVDADNEAEIAERLGADPWIPMGLLGVADVQRWEVLLGEVPARRGTATRE